MLSQRSIRLSFAVTLLVLVGCGGGEADRPVPARPTVSGSPEAVSPVRPVGTAPSAAAPNAAAPNAADDYRRLFAAFPDEVRRRFRRVGSQATIDTTAAEVLSGLQPSILELCSITRAEHCDFEVDLGAGVGTAFPHLAAMRHLGRILAADANRLAAAGDGSGAGGTARGAGSAGPACGGGDLMIGKLVGLSMIALAIDRADALVDRSLLDASARAMVRRELERIDRTNPLDAKAALSAERDLAISSLRTGVGLGEQVRTRWERMLPLQREQSVRAVKDLFEAVLGAWDLPDGLGRIRALEAAIANPVVEAATPRMSLFREQVAQFGEHLEAGLARLGAQAP